MGPRLPITDATVSARKITVASGQVLTGSTVGSLSLTTDASQPLHLKDVLVNDGLSANLLSMSKLCQSPDVKGIWTTSDCSQVMSHDGEVMQQANNVNGLYVLTGKSVASRVTDTSAMATSVAVTDAERRAHLQWHARLGHMSVGGMDKLVASRAVDGLDGLKVCKSDDLCEGCMRGKAHRAAFSKTPSERRQTGG